MQKCLGIGVDTVRYRCRHMGLVICLVRLGQTHMLTCGTWLGIGVDTVRHGADMVSLGADMVRCRCRHGQV